MTYTSEEKRAAEFRLGGSYSTKPFTQDEVNEIGDGWPSYSITDVIILRLVATCRQAWETTAPQPSQPTIAASWEELKESWREAMQTLKSLSDQTQERKDDGSHRS